MKNLFIAAASIFLLSLSLVACKFNFGSESSTTKTETTNRTSSNKSKNTKSKTDNTKAAGTETGDDSTTGEDATDSKSDTTDLTIKRTYYAADPNKPADMGSRDGDYTYFRELEGGGTAGFLYKAKPQEAIYVLWGGKVIAGPLTTEEQVRKVTEQLADQMKDEHETQMTIINNYPTGKF